MAEPPAKRTRLSVQQQQQVIQQQIQQQQMQQHQMALQQAQAHQLQQQYFQQQALQHLQQQQLMQKMIFANSSQTKPPDDKTLIGEGTFGKVFRQKDSKSNEQVAVKEFKAKGDIEGIPIGAYREFMLLRELQHPNIVCARDISVDPKAKTIKMVMDYAEYDLNELIKYHAKILFKPPVSHMCKSVMQQLLLGLDYLHSNWIIHRDLKPSNVLVMGLNSSQAGVVKIADFGLARIFQSPLQPLYHNGVVVTIWYRSPELLLGARHHTSAVDMWAMGCIFAELLSAVPIFPGRERDKNNPTLFQDSQLDKIFNILGVPDESKWPNLKDLPYWVNRSSWTELLTNINSYPRQSKLATTSPYFKDPLVFDLLQKLLEYDPNTRLSASAALQHDYFKSAPLPSPNCLQLTANPYPSREEMAKIMDSQARRESGRRN